jgi:hypothetical protein
MNSAAYRRIGRTLLLQVEAAKVVSKLAEAGIRSLVLKGCAVAGDLTPIEARSVGDVDLLVEAGDWGRAVEVLVALGARHVRLSPRWLASRLHHAASFVTAHGATIDLHTALADPIRWRVDVAEMFARAQPFELAGHGAYRPCPEDLILHIAINQAKDDYFIDRAAPRDLEGVIALSPDWGQVVERAGRWGCAVALYLTLEHGRRALDLAVPEWVIDALRPPAWRLRGLEAVLDLDRPRPYRYLRHPRRLRQLLVGPLATDDLGFFPRRTIAFALVGAADLALAPATVTADVLRRKLGLDGAQYRP